ncbi:hypothetical protein [Devosia ginsengisoli]|uniref:hypothetical protein n=1 Tax=Devosia ginsengisoli TaxID=400770 RepID=UPI0026F25F7E|nr:hypothetical protein [Devosia ginsengisoli]MCR6672182.1 hypothetical protein [Devosia ginsengisoli]
MTTDQIMLSSQCACGAVISTPAPAAADIGAAYQAQLDAGWGHDDHGRCLCPQCMVAPPAEPTPDVPEQGRLF